jgi:NitT/TauT family transport system permease protein
MSSAPASNPVPQRQRRISDSPYLKPALGALSVVVCLAVWQAAVGWFGVPHYVLPEPLGVWNALIDGLSGSVTNRGSFWYHLLDTFQTTVFGFLIGSAIGIALAALMAESVYFHGIVFPYVVILQSLPKIAIAPLFIIWFGYQIESKIAMAATLTLFPVLLNSLQGLTTTDPDRLEVMAALKATRWQTFRHVKLPSALPLIFAGLNLGIVYAQLGAIVAEFVGAQRGMGVVMVQLQSVSDTAGVFAVLVVLAATGYILITVMRAIHRHVIFWERTSSKGRAG